MISILLEIPVAPIVPFVRFLLGCSHARSPSSRCASRQRVLGSSFFSAQRILFFFGILHARAVFRWRFLRFFTDIRLPSSLVF
jgi:hypothetical protein